MLGFAKGRTPPPSRPQADARPPAPGNGPSGPSIRLVWFWAGVACAVVVLAAVGLTVASYRREMGDTRRVLSSLDAVLAEETARSFQNVALVLESLVVDVAKENIASPEDYVRLRTGDQTARMLRSRTAGVPQLDALTLVAADGRLINFSRSIPLPEVNLSDRDYFRHLRDTPTTEPYLSEPVKNRGNGAWTVYLGRRLTAPDGRFLGLVLGAIDLGYFQDFYSSLALEKNVAVSLWRGDGILLARNPPLSVIGTNPKPIWMGGPLVGSDSAVYDAPPTVDEHPRTVAARRVPGVEVVVSVSMTRQAALADWYLHAYGAAGATVLCIGAVLGFATVLSRQIRTLRALTQAIEDRTHADGERERTEAQLRQAQKMEAVGHLTGGIAHDFNNMLAIVVGSLDVMGRRLERGDVDVRQFLDSAMEGANRAASLTQRLLAFSRRQPLAPKVLDANGFIEGTAELVERTIGKSLRFRMELASGRWRVEADESQLENAILNLALNARDAMPEGGDLVLRTSYAKLPPDDGKPGGDHVVISLCDTGTGMSPETLARAVEPFFTTKDVGQGTGLGLSQVYGFVNQSGGRLRIESTPGKGTTVAIQLPRTHASIERTRPLDAVPRARHPGETVLVVDDEESVRRTAAEMLRELGYTVIHAGDPETAIQAATRTHGLALLLTDVVMPALDGRALAAEIRSRRPDLAVLYATGRSVSDVGHGSRVLSKPFDSRRLAEAVRSAIDAPIGRAGIELQAAVGL